MLTTIDLFAGAGGISEGFRQAGFRCLYANDWNIQATETFRANHPDTWVQLQQIEDVDAAVVRGNLRLAQGELDVLVGGPPCTGFSINAPGRFLEDPRNALFRHYMRFLDEFKPRSFLFENVPGMLSLGGGVVFQEIMELFAQHGYEAAAQILFAAHYGVPQERWRLIILGSREGSSPRHPYRTHDAPGRANFTGGRTMTIPLAPSDRAALQPPVTVGDAISDLPRLALGEGAEMMEYTHEPGSSYAKLMRSGSVHVFSHLAAKLSPQNVERLKYVPPGGSWRNIPDELLPAGMRRARKSDHTRRYGRLRFDGLSGTIMTKCDPHWGAVFLPDQDRSLTVREAARLQSFPDVYRFLGPRVAQYEQVGNAVPPLLARAVAESLADHLADRMIGQAAV